MLHQPETTASPCVLAVLAGLLIVVGGCAPVVRIDDALLARTAPLTIAVLPFELVLAPGERDEGGALARRVDALRRAVARQVALRYRTLAPDDVDAALVRAALPLARSPRLAAPRLTQALGVDAVVRGRVTTLDNLEGGVLFVHTITADLRLVSARGDLLVEVAHTERAIGGLLPESQQAIRAILTTIENSTEAGYLRLAERFAEAVVRSIPDAPAPAGREATPAIGVARLLAPERTLVPGDVVAVELRGTPGLTAVADLGPTLRGVPLEEVEPGLYRGSHEVGLGEVGGAVPAVRLRDAFGHGAWRALQTAPLVLAARPLSPPRDARRVVDPTTGAVRVTWRAVPGAATYRVYALEVDGRASSVADTTFTFADVPAATRLAVAGVDGRGVVGRLAVAGAPASLVAADEQDEPGEPDEPEER